VALDAFSNDQDVNSALLAYNPGSVYLRAGAGPDLSPYVMNNFDAVHANMA